LKGSECNRGEGRGECKAGYRGLAQHIFKASFGSGSLAQTFGSCEGMGGMVLELAMRRLGCQRRIRVGDPKNIVAIVTLRHKLRLNRMRLTKRQCEKVEQPTVEAAATLGPIPISSLLWLLGPCDE